MNGLNICLKRGAIEKLALFFNKAMQVKKRTNMNLKNKQT